MIHKIHNSKIHNPKTKPRVVKPKIDRLSRLPVEILRMIVNYVDDSTWVVCLQVSKTLRSIAQIDSKRRGISMLLSKKLSFDIPGMGITKITALEAMAILVVGSYYTRYIKQKAQADEKLRADVNNRLTEAIIPTLVMGACTII